MFSAPLSTLPAFKVKPGEKLEDGVWGNCEGQNEDEHQQIDRSSAPSAICPPSDKVAARKTGKDDVLDSNIFQIVLDLVGPLEADKFLSDHNVRALSFKSQIVVKRDRLMFHACFCFTCLGCWLGGLALIICGTKQIRRASFGIS